MQSLALAALLLIAGLAAAGPTGLLAWAEHAAMLEEQRAAVAELEEQRADLANRVALLDPDRADPDLVGELLRERMNVIRPDEIVIPIED